MNMRRQRPAQVLLDAEGMRSGVRALRRKCPHMRAIHDLAGDPPLRDYRADFASIARIVVGQQLSLTSAQAIWGRLQAAAHPVTAETMLALDDATLRAVGLSGAKVKTLRALGAAVAGGLDLQGIAEAADEEVHAALTAVSGIGPWTADIYLLFCLGRSDAFAAGDLALQTAARAILELEARPSRLELHAIAERWRPWRGVAAHLLWAYYKVADRALLFPKSA